MGTRDLLGSEAEAVSGGGIMRLRPLFDRILIMPDPRETETESGLLIPDSVHDQSMAQYGVVLEVSEQTAKHFQQGDHIAYRKYSGVEFPITDPKTQRQTGKLLMLKLEEVLCKVDLQAELVKPETAPDTKSSLLGVNGEPLEQ